MKRIIFKGDDKSIEIEKINDSSHVGVVIKSDTKGQIVKSKYGFFFMGIFEHDISKKWFAPSKLEYLRDFTPEPTAYVFETKEALIEWLKS